MYVFAISKQVTTCKLLIPYICIGTDAIHTYVCSYVYMYVRTVKVLNIL